MERVLLQEAAAGVGWSRLIVGGRTDVLPRHLERQDIILLTIGENLVPLLSRVGSFLGRNILAEESKSLLAFHHKIYLRRSTILMAPCARVCARTRRILVTLCGSKQFEQNAISSSKEVGF